MVMKVEIPEKESGFSQGQGEEGAFDSSFRRALAVVFVVDIENGEVEALACTFTICISGSWLGSVMQLSCASR